MTRTITITLVIKGREKHLDLFEQSIEDALDGGIIQDSILGVLEMKSEKARESVEFVESTAARAAS